MKKQKKFSIVILLFFFISTVFGQSANIELTAQNFQGTEGQLIIGLFNKASDFKEKANPFRAVKLEISDSTVSYTFLDIPTGNYALAVFHDENIDGKANTKSMKIPTEGVGVSGKMPKMRAPKFDDAVFKLENDTSIVIRLMYPGSH